MTIPQLHVRTLANLLLTNLTGGAIPDEFRLQVSKENFARVQVLSLLLIVATPLLLLPDWANRDVHHGWILDIGLLFLSLVFCAISYLLPPRSWSVKKHLVLAFSLCVCVWSGMISALESSDPFEYTTIIFAVLGAATIVYLEPRELILLLTGGVVSFRGLSHIFGTTRSDLGQMDIFLFGLCGVALLISRFHYLNYAREFMARRELAQAHDLLQMRSQTQEAAERELRSYRDQLQEMVREKTRQLQNVNNALQQEISRRALAQQELRYERDLLEIIIEHTRAHLAYLDREFRFARVNVEFARTLGFTPDLLIGRAFFELFPDEENQRVFKLVCETGKPYERKATRLTFAHQNDPSYWDWTLIPVQDSMGVCRGLVLSLLDVTESRKIHLALSESEYKFRSIVESTLDGIVLINEHGSIEEWNRGQERITELTRGEVIGKNIGEIYGILAYPPGVVIEHLVPGAHDRVITGMPSDAPVNIEIVCASGIRKTLQHTFFPIAGHANPTMTGAVIRDITASQRATGMIRSLNQALKRRAQDLALANEELKSFAYSVSHDLRAPLRAISGFSNILFQEYASSLDPQARIYLSHIVESAESMGQLIEGLLRLSRATREQLCPVKVDLSDIARGIVSQLRALEPDRAVTVCIREGLNAVGDAALLRTLLENLLSNAWKFTGKTANATIELGTTINGDRPVFFLRDNGAGFDMKNAHQLFTPFQRLHTRKEYPGTGVGLSIVQRIIGRHGGMIWAESHPGRGATFYFTLSEGTLSVNDTGEQV